MALKIGDKIPETLGVNQHGKEVKSLDFSGKKLVLYFYPKDNTPGCTAQACSLRDDYAELKKQGYEILGVSVDSDTSHQKFINKHQLPFDLIADTDKVLAEKFGTWGEKKSFGRTYMGMFRTTFVIDENGIIQKIFQPKEVKTKEHGKQILSL
ncbi:MAG: thioredoxin-dependent thiol peroxidase [Bacteroidales bacterium]|nr:thioredoxin-dependent thiol peroxidase [Bacteroidales bacterium]